MTNINFEGKNLHLIYKNSLALYFCQLSGQNDGGDNYVYTIAFLDMI